MASIVPEVQRTEPWESLIPGFPRTEPQESRFMHTFSDLFGQHMFHSHHSSHAPYFDISESNEAYFLEGDFPGMMNTADISLEWIGKRTLVVEANVPKPDFEQMWDISIGKGLERTEKHEDASNKDNDKDGKTTNGHHIDSLNDIGPMMAGTNLRPQKHLENGIRHWIRERRTGHLYRTFTFPENVETGTVKAKLHQGQLDLMVTKSEPMHAPEKRKVEISAGEALGGSGTAAAGWL